MPSFIGVVNDRMANLTVREKLENRTPSPTLFRLLRYLNLLDDDNYFPLPFYLVVADK